MPKISRSVRRGVDSYRLSMFSDRASWFSPFIHSQLQYSTGQSHCQVKSDLHFVSSVINPPNWFHVWVGDELSIDTDRDSGTNWTMVVECGKDVMRVTDWTLFHGHLFTSR